MTNLSVWQNLTFQFSKAYKHGTIHIARNLPEFYTAFKIFFAKLLTNIENVLLGALWMAILSGKAWYVTASASALKNLIMLPVQTVLLVLLFGALLPVL